MLIYQLVISQDGIVKEKFFTNPPDEISRRLRDQGFDTFQKTIYVEEN